MSLANAIGAFLKPQTPLQQLLEDINFQRTKEMRQMIKDDNGFVVLQGTTYWTDLFVRHFLFQSEPVHNIDSDDLLFFVRKKHVKSSSRQMPKYDTEIDVFRKDSRKLPIGDPDVDWEETVYLNMVIHQFDYTLTLAICTRTSPKELQVLRRHSQRVYASPSRRKMDTKGEGEEITYPHICFMVDNFDEVFSDILVRDGEMVCVELVANDKDGSVQGVIFLGSIRYDALKKVYDARQSSLSSKVAQRMSFGLFSSGAGVQTRCEFVRMKGPQGKGHAEMAVTKPKGSGVETPTSEPGFCATDMWDDWDEGNDDYYTYRHQRRLSDPSANLNNFSRYGWRTKNVHDSASTSAGAKARSENEGLDNLASEVSEIEAGDLRDDQGPAFSAKELKTKDAKTISTTNTPLLSNDLVNGVVPSPSSASSSCSNCFGSKTCKRWSSVSSSSSAQMSEIYCPACEESSNETPACLNKMPNKNIKTQHKTILSFESELIVGKEKKYDAKKNLLRNNTIIYSDKNKKSQKKTDSCRKEKLKIKFKEPIKEIRSPVKKSSKIKIDKMRSNKTKDDVGTNDNKNILGIKVEEYEIADDATSLNGAEINLSVKEPKIAILSENDNKDMINVHGKEELPVVREPLVTTSEVTKFVLEQSMPQISSDKLCNRFLNGMSLKSKNHHQRNSSKSATLNILNADINKKSNSEDLEFYNEIPFTIPYNCNGNSNKSIPPRELLKKDSKIPFPIQRNSTLPRMKKSTNYQTLYNKALNMVPKRRTPDGTNIYYWCDLTKTIHKELDDGAHNPLWTSRGFTQTFHFWKENRRQQSAPLNAFLTYVTLPWWSIAKDLLDHRENPILTF